MPWKVAAGVFSVAVLGGLVVTSVNRAPNDGWTFITGGVALLILAAVIRTAMRRKRIRMMR